MINPKRVISLAKKWQRMAANKPKRISDPKPDGGLRFSLADKGHFVVYTTDNRRFAVPLGYLTKRVFRELFRMSEDEFGLPSNGPITLPCGSIFLEYVIYLVQGHIPEDLEIALLTSMATCHGSASCSNIVPGQSHKRTLVYVF
ncbi:hypothetical protein CJ030_MR2G002399 [Morella rubra]|uniref:Uncharacterized protein n=1 Tax=Morella rubra TaxID=262757 RepID=A0A6A1WFX2_9ROSI|nr:hypothetical protein CJ030_MR2G002399 [Morella rubra]